MDGIFTTGSEKLMKEFDYMVSSCKADPTSKEIAMEKAMWAKVAEIIKKKCSESIIFNAKVMDKELTFERLCHYLMDKAKPFAVPGVSSMAMIEDGVVHTWIIEYYSGEGRKILEAEAKKKEEAAKKAAEVKAKTESKKKKKTNKSVPTDETPAVTDTAPEADSHLVDKVELEVETVTGEDGQLSLF